jgi:hypothetical protein
MKSTVAPWRYGALNGSTTTWTPCWSDSMSPSTAPLSKPSPYWKPEQPPPWMATRRTVDSPSGSSAISWRILDAAVDVSVRMVSCRSIVAMRAMVAGPVLVIIPRRGDRENGPLCNTGYLLG